MPDYAICLKCKLKVPSTLYATTRFFSTCSEKFFLYSSRVGNRFDPPKQEDVAPDADQ